MSLAVVYLARAAEGLDAIGRFIASYKATPSGREHELVILQKGSFGSVQKRDLNELLDGISHRSMEFDDTGVDITVYLAAARQLSHEQICFLNTSTEIVADGWLAKLDSSLKEGVGIVGATGSYESLYSSLELVSKVMWFTERGRIPYDDNIARHYSSILLMNASTWLTRTLPRSKRILLIMLFSRITRIQPNLEQKWLSVWPAIRNKFFEIANDVPHFPNPHIRSNGFMVRRSQLLEFDWPPIVTKDDACRFESGFNSLTRRLRKQGFSALIVGKDGAYDIAQWPRSGTFRFGSQSNLLLADKQTRNFVGYSQPERDIFTLMTWGNLSGLDPTELPLFGLSASFNADAKKLNVSGQSGERA